MTFFREKNNNHNNRPKTYKQTQRSRSHIFESQGPSGKTRGTCAQLVERYLLLGRDAQREGDSVLSEAFFQHAEHYRRLGEELIGQKKSVTDQAKKEDHPVKDPMIEDHKPQEIEAAAPPAERKQAPDKKAEPKKEYDLRRYRHRRTASYSTESTPSVTSASTTGLQHDASSPSIAPISNSTKQPLPEHSPSAQD